jgi:hypothetical protein
VVRRTDLSHNLSHTLTVSDKASIRQELTPVFENFRQQLDSVSAGGNTAVYDALDTARAMLVNYPSALTKLRKRIIIVSDGADTSSENRPREVCFAIQRDGIIVDSVQVGDWSDKRLHAISVATGINHSFCPMFSLIDVRHSRRVSFLPSNFTERCVEHFRK